MNHHKLRVLASVAAALESHQITWGVGASLLLWHLGIVDEFHDIDLLVKAQDAPVADGALAALGEKSVRASDPLYSTSHFYEYTIDGVEIDVMADFGVNRFGSRYHYFFDESAVSERRNYAGATIPFTAAEDWFVLYRMMGRNAKADAVDAFLRTYGIARPDLLRASRKQPLPDFIAAQVDALLAGPPPQKIQAAARLETPRLLLRPFAPSDREDVFAYSSNPMVGPAAGWKPHPAIEVTDRTLEEILMKPGIFAVTLRETGRVIGSVGLHSTEVSRADSCNALEIGYVLHPDYWGCGYVTEAAETVMDNAFRSLQVERFWVGYFDGNDRSRRVAERLGFRYSHTKRTRAEMLDGVEMTEHLCSLTRDEFYSLG